MSNSPYGTAEAAQEYIAAFRKRLIATDVARDHEIVGCTDEEIVRVQGVNPNIAVPELFFAFMREMGQSMGGLFSGTDIGYPECVNYHNEFLEYADEDPTFHPEEWFIFGSHQGYQFYYFRDGDPRVYLHSEGEQNPFQIWDSFAALIEDNLEDEIPLVFARRYGDLSNWILDDPGWSVSPVPDGQKWLTLADLPPRSWIGRQVELMRDFVARLLDPKDFRQLWSEAHGQVTKYEEHRAPQIIEAMDDLYRAIRDYAPSPTDREDERTKENQLRDANCRALVRVESLRADGRTVT